MMTSRIAGIGARLARRVARCTARPDATGSTNASRVSYQARRAGTTCAIAATVFAMSVSCRGKSDAPPRAAAVVDPPAVATGPGCAADGLWKPCTLMDRLVHAGVGPKETEADTTHVSFLTPPGIHYQVGKFGLLIAFYYADSLKAKREWSKLDTLRLVPPGDTVTRWPARPSTFRAGNLVGAFFGSNAAQIERVGLALRAGLPAPAKAP